MQSVPTQVEGVQEKEQGEVIQLLAEIKEYLKENNSILKENNDILKQDHGVILAMAEDVRKIKINTQ